MSDTVEERASTAPPGDLTIEIGMGRSSFVGSGDAAAVLEAFRAFREFYSEVAQGLPDEPEADAGKDPGSLDPPAGARGAGVGGPSGKTAPAPDDDVPPLKPFLERKKFRGNHLVALGIVLWAKRKDGKDSVKQGEIDTLWKSSGGKHPGVNLTRDIKRAITEGWVSKDGDVYSVTGFGEQTWDKLPAKSDG